MASNCEYDMLLTFSKNLKVQLKQEIKGTVFCELTKGNLIVTIYGANDIIFKYKWYNLTSEIVQGLTSERLSISIVKRYKQHIENLFFL